MDGGRCFIAGFGYAGVENPLEYFVAKANLHGGMVYLYPPDQVSVIAAAREGRQSKWLVRYTGRTRTIEGRLVHEVDLLGQFPEDLVVKFRAENSPDAREATRAFYKIGETEVSLVPRAGGVMPAKNSIWWCQPLSVVGVSKAGRVFVWVWVIEPRPTRKR